MKPSTKYSCIGEFSVRTSQICPNCWQDEDNDECEFCAGKAVNGYVLHDTKIPWTTMKAIYYKIKELEE